MLILIRDQEVKKGSVVLLKLFKSKEKRVTEEFPVFLENQLKSQSLNTLCNLEYQVHQVYQA